MNNKAHPLPSKRERRRVIAALLLGVLTPIGVCPLHALPVLDGAAPASIVISGDSHTLTLTQSAARAVVQWSDFSIGASETVRFQHQSSTDATLNRVTGALSSQLLGRLEANGSVYLINPNGIVVGNGASIDVGAFMATTLTVNDSEFLAGGDLNLSGSSTAVIHNLGTIRANQGDVLLIARDIINEGTLRAPQGTVALAAGSEVLIKASGDERLFIKAESAPGTVRQTRQGLIEATQAELKAQGGNPYALALNNEGIVRATGVSQQGGRILLTSPKGSIRQQGQLLARGTNGRDGGEIRIQAQRLSNSGTVDVSGASGGTVRVIAVSLSQEGEILADGFGAGGLGGNVHLSIAGSYFDLHGARLSATGQSTGGKIHLNGSATSLVRLSGSYEVSSALGTGGTLWIEGDRITLTSATLRADGETGGGTVLVGGGFRGESPFVVEASWVEGSASTRLSANALHHGNGGTVILWSQGEAHYLGSLQARGGSAGGNGGLLEVSGLQRASFEGTPDASAPFGSSGMFWFDPQNIIIAEGGEGGVRKFNFDDPNPAANNGFGEQALVLPNGDLLVAAPYDDFFATNSGAVYYFDGRTGALISILRGSSFQDQVGFGGFVSNDSSNFLVLSPRWDNGSFEDAGAVTLGRAGAGIGGVVSAANSFVGAANFDNLGSGGAKHLGNDNFVIISPFWDNGGIENVGAVTWLAGNGSTSGTLSVANSLIGSQQEDQIGRDGVHVLPNRHYVVVSTLWDNASVEDAGAVTWGNGNSGIVGVVSPSNSLVGDKYLDVLGSGGIVVLPNGDYLVLNRYWDDGVVQNVGAVTRGLASGGTVGIVSAANSLIGSTAEDQIGSGGITILENGNYVIVSPLWDNGAAEDAGAVTWVDKTLGLTGVVSIGNSLVGSSDYDIVGSGGVVALKNGNYVVISRYWDNGGISNAGAVTWGNGTTGIVGPVSFANSLIGQQSEDQLGASGVTALTNGHYVVSSPLWDNGSIEDAGAATWGNGSTGITGFISSSNSFIGSQIYDSVSLGGVLALKNGNYVVISPFWYSGPLDNLGAISWGNGATGTSGVISAANSMVGSSPQDQLGSGGGLALSNGDFVLLSPLWDNGGVEDVGAITWVSGSGPVSGVVSIANSLVGSTQYDSIGSGGIFELKNGNFVVVSQYWDNGALADVGAVTWGSASGGIAGLVSAANSLIGSRANDQVGSGGVLTLANGNYLVRSERWDNGTLQDAGAVTWGDGTRPTTGAITPINSIIGSREFSTLETVLNNAALEYSVVRFSQDNPGGTVAAVNWGSGNSLLAFGTNPGTNVTLSAAAIERIASSGTSVTLQANNDIFINQEILISNPFGNGGSLTFQAGRSIFVNARIVSDNGDVTMIANETAANGVIDAYRLPGAAEIRFSGLGSIDAGSGIVTLIVRASTDKTNNEAGAITLGEIRAGGLIARSPGGLSTDALLLAKFLLSKESDNRLADLQTRLASLSQSKFRINLDALRLPLQDQVVWAWSSGLSAGL